MTLILRDKRQDTKEKREEIVRKFICLEFR
jgi:hypothetical protein